MMGILTKILPGVDIPALLKKPGPAVETRAEAAGA
jgi:hypothetical protein